MIRILPLIFALILVSKLSAQCRKVNVKEAIFFDLTEKSHLDSIKMTVFVRGKFKQYNIRKEEYDAVLFSYNEEKRSICIKNSKCIAAILDKTITLENLDQKSFYDVFFKNEYIGYRTPNIYLVERNDNKVKLIPIIVQTEMLSKL